MTTNRIQIQSILFNNNPADIKRALEAISRATRVLQRKRDFIVDVIYGDCSPDNPCLSAHDVREMEDILKNGTFRYVYFHANLGSAEGHNRLAAGVESGYLLIQNPDVIGDSEYLLHLLGSFDNNFCGISEARQLPIEHPKDYDAQTGETSWATTACALIPAELFIKVSGFDAKYFFLYCDDVDLSWRVRLAGRKIIFKSSAVVFHDKRLKKDGSWMPSSAERYYSIEAALLMAHKYSRPARVKEVLALCDHLAPSDDVFGKAATRYREMEKLGDLPKPIDPEHRISEFYRDDYSIHRFII